MYGEYLLKEILINSLSLKIERKLVQDLIDSFIKMKHYLFIDKYEECLVFTGHFCETVLKIIEYNANKVILNEIRDKNNLLRKIENYTQLSDQERIIIPRLTGSVYDIRNRKRSGHAAGILPTKNDTLLVDRVCTYILVEFLLMYYSDDIAKIHKMIDNLITRKAPFIEEIDGILLGYGNVSLQSLILYILYTNSNNGSLSRVDIISKLPTYAKVNVQNSISQLKKKNKIYENSDKKLFLTQNGSIFLEDYISKMK